MDNLTHKIINVISYAQDTSDVNTVLEHNDKQYRVSVKEIKPDVEFTKVNHNIYGNPRYVCGWWEFGTPDYATALKLARKIGGGKFHNKQFGGGVVFCTYDLDSIKRKIIAIRAEQKALKENK